MERSQQSVTKIEPVPVKGAGLPTVAANDPVALRVVPNQPPHTQPQSQASPTSDWARYLMLFVPSRYIPRGVFGTILEEHPYVGTKWARAVQSVLTKPGEWLQKKFPHSTKANKEALAYNAMMGIGSLGLSVTYSWNVYKDIKNIFRETVADETGKSPDAITSADLRNSDNRIVQVTMKNFGHRALKRICTDLLFFPAAALRSSGLGDLMVGVKMGQTFAETWKRKTTMFEDLITFVINKINPRNGLGQAIGVGEIFDLYQHYEQEYNADKAFANVLENGNTGEGARWAQSQPIFTRLTELMNLTYAYKHSSVIDPQTGRAIQQANFALPKFIYLLGHDLIDVDKPAQTLATIEIANQYGIPAVKEMQAMLQAGQPLEAVEARFPVAPHVRKQDVIDADKKNGVIAKGSTLQLDTADEMPQTTVAVDSIATQSVLHAAPNMPAIA